MTNKLPIVGKRYRFKHYKTPYPEVEVLAITNSYAVYLGKDKHGFDAVGHCGKLVFLQDYEELPEDKAETKPAIKENLTLELSPEVKEAMEELKKADNWFRNNASITLPEHCFKLSNAAFYLLNALDKKFKVNETSESVDVKEEEVKEKEEEFFSAFAGKLIEYQGKR